MAVDWFEQKGYRCRLEWGRRGAKAAGAQGNILVVVDVLSFSTAAVTAIHQGGIIYPCISQEQTENIAIEVGGEAAVNRRDVPEKGRFSLSPMTMLQVKAGDKIAVNSPNGSTCCKYGEDCPAVLVGSLLNAEAVATAAVELASQHGCGVTILACGERWETQNEDGELRYAIEDYLGAGAILSYLELSKSPEAEVCEAAFNATRSSLESLLWNCGSGIELRDKGYQDDVTYSSQLVIYDSVPILRSGNLVKLV